jgi:hypothetical protein
MKYTSLFWLLLLFSKICAEEQQFPNFCFTCVNPQAPTAIVYLYSHGIDPRKTTGVRQARDYIANNIITGICYTFSYADSIKTINFGQEDDYARLEHAYNLIREKHPTAAIVLLGLSRGASNILHFLARQTKENLVPIKAIILESPFDSVDSMLDHIAKKYCWMIPKSSYLLKKLVSHLPNYKNNQEQPVNFVQKISTSIPFLIVYSLQDKVVSAQGVQTIIDLLKKNNNPVTAVELKIGKNSTASFQKKFQDAAAAFLHDNKNS